MQTLHLIMFITIRVELPALRAKLKGALAVHVVAMVTCYILMTVTFSPMIVHLYDTSIVASLVKIPHSTVRKVLETAASLRETMTN